MKAHDLTQARTQRLFSRCDELGIEAVLILNIHNIRYFTGFTGSEGVLIARPGGMALLVDGRYGTQARQETQGVEIVQFKDRLASLTRAINDWGLRSLAVESSTISLQQFTELTKTMPRLNVRSLGSEITELRALKDRHEAGKIKKAAIIAGRALDGVIPLLKPGAREADIALELEYLMKKLGSEGVSFESIVASGKNSALPHARPSARRLKKGDFLVIDYGCVCEGYHSDETCTFGIGGISAEQARVYEIVKGAHDRALSAVKAGVPCKQVDSAARSYIEEHGYGPFFSHGTGHGVGLEVHEFPRISCQADAVLQAGMVVTIEPGIYIPGLFGVRIESLAVVRENGCDILSPMGKKINVIA